jgi:glycosyltransferase involved in cell wall biosynthesis
MIKIALIIRSLDHGGAERQLLALAKALDKTRFSATILTFYPGGVLEKDLAGCGIRLISLNKGGRWDLPRFLSRLFHELRKLRPDIIHSYLDIPNVIAVCAKPFCSRPAVLWGVRSANFDLDNYDWLRRLGSFLERRLAYVPDRIIVNSHAGRRYLISRGYPDEKLVVIQNGFDTTQFRPNNEARFKIRREWGIADEQVLIGLVARFDPVKDHATFLRAASVLSQVKPDARFVCVGSGPVVYRQKLSEAADQLSLSGKIVWAGMRSDMADVYNAFDINVSSSISEGCPNVVGEAMACAVPCVVTDAGDAAMMVGDTGFVCSPQEPQALAASLISCIESDRISLGLRARRRIEENWNIWQLSQNTERVLLNLAPECTSRPVGLITSSVETDSDALKFQG